MSFGVFRYPDQTIAADVNPMVTAPAAAFIMRPEQQFVNCTYSATGAQTVTLPAIASFVAGRWYVVKDVGGVANTNNITIATPGSETIDGAATIAIAAADGSVILYSDGTNWLVAASA